MFQEATATSRDPVYVTGAFYTMRALDEVRRWEDQAGGPPEANLDELSASEGDLIVDDAQRGMMELFDRIRKGATLDEALALFPQMGDEHSPD